MLGKSEIRESSTEKTKPFFSGKVFFFFSNWTCLAEEKMRNLFG